MMIKRFICSVILLVVALFLVGAAEITIPLERTENSVGPDEAYLMQDSIIMCGQLVDAGNALTYFGAANVLYLGLYSTSFPIGSANCNGLDAETEAGAANVAISALFPPFKVSGFYCIISADPTNDVTFTFRSAGADTTPVISCTIAGTGSGKSCSTTTATTTDIASGATISMKASYNEDLDVEDAWCKLFFAVKSK